MYAELQRLVEQSQAELVDLIATRQREAERHAQEIARGLENELSHLRRRSNELEAHAQTHDKVLFLQVEGAACGPHAHTVTCTKVRLLRNLVQVLRGEKNIFLCPKNNSPVH